MEDHTSAFEEWIRIRIGTQSHHGFLVAGEEPESAFIRRVNEPCRHENCPNALIAFGLLDSPEEARETCIQGINAPPGVLEHFGYVVYEFILDDAMTGRPSHGRANQYLQELCDGRADGPAWAQFRFHREADDVVALRFPRRAGVTPLLVLRNSLDLVELHPVGPLLPAAA